MHAHDSTGALAPTRARADQSGSVTSRLMHTCSRTISASVPGRPRRGAAAQGDDDAQTAHPPLASWDTFSRSVMTRTRSMARCRAGRLGLSHAGRCAHFAAGATADTRAPSASTEPVRQVAHLMLDDGCLLRHERSCARAVHRIGSGLVVRLVSRELVPGYQATLTLSGRHSRGRQACDPESRSWQW